MRKYKASERKVDLYDIGDGLTLMNVIEKNPEGKIASIGTYIGAERNGFSCVGYADNLDGPGVRFNYAWYVRTIEANLDYYLDAFFTNISN